MRIALGARTTDVVSLVVRQGTGPVISGIVIGIGIALTGAKLVASLLYETSAGGLGLAALAAAIIPAFRAARVDAAMALRAE